MNPELEAVWTQMYGTSYPEVIGRRIVERFKDNGQTFTVGDVCRLAGNAGSIPTGMLLTIKLVSAGSPVRMPKGKNVVTPTRRAVIFTVVRVEHAARDAFMADQVSHAFLWSNDPPRLFHDVLESLAHASVERPDGP